ncbi:MAG: polymorphic toxin type 23 domain-containing protein [Bacteroidota bacterium]
MILLTLGWGIPSGLSSQTLGDLPERAGLSGGLKLDLGYPVNRVGFTLQAYYTWDFVQLNGGVEGTYNLSHLGVRPVQKGWEAQASLGAAIGWGSRDSLSLSPFLHPVSNQTRRRYALAYAWRFYWDQRQTNQITGFIGLHLGKWEIVTENDAYTGLVFDRFRTGAFAVTYRQDSLRLGLVSTLWTGNTFGISRTTDTNYRGRYGYKDLRNAPYGRFSHGILAAQVSLALPFNQVAQFSGGIDAEQVRHLIQNRLIHDMWFFPESWTTVRNPHYPMLDQVGRPYLGLPGQRIRPVKPFIQAALNPNLFY